MRLRNLYYCIGIASLLGTGCLTGCASGEPTLTVSNPSDIDRTGEMVEFSYPEMEAKHKWIAEGFIIQDEEGQEVPYQRLANGQVIFPVSLEAHGKAVYKVVPGTPSPVEPITCGRHYPERLDDIAWENDKSGYRAYGPALQRTGEKAYGYDILVKNVKEPVLEQRYAMELDKEARAQIAAWYKAGEKAKADSLARAISYHVDHGNGMDCYNVGPTLGGGTAALWVDSAIVYPYCYQDYEIIDNGPLRFTVRLTFPPTTIKGDTNVIETRVITLDAGSHLNRTEVTYKHLSEPAEVVAGIVIHPQNPDGYRYDQEKRYIAYADSTNNTQAGNGLIYVGAVFADSMQDACVDKEHVLGFSPYQPGSTFCYYWGSGWSKAGVPSMEAWCDYLSQYARCVSQPLQLTIK